MAVDMTSWKMRCHYKLMGGHVHCRIFGPGQGGAGDLTLRVEEWPWFVEHHVDWQFVGEETLSSVVELAGDDPLTDEEWAAFMP